MRKLMGLLLAAVLLAGCSSGGGDNAQGPGPGEVPFLDNITVGMNIQDMDNKEAVYSLESHLPYLDYATIQDMEFQVLYLSDAANLNSVILLTAEPTTTEEEQTFRDNLVSMYGEPASRGDDQGTDTTRWFFDEGGNAQEQEEGAAYGIIYMLDEPDSDSVSIRLDFDYLLWSQEENDDEAQGDDQPQDGEQDQPQDDEEEEEE